MSKMNKTYNSPKQGKKFPKNYQFDEEIVSLKDIKRSKEHKHYRNYENALRAKNVDRLLSYEDE